MGDPTHNVLVVAQVWHFDTLQVRIQIQTTQVVEGSVIAQLSRNVNLSH